MKPNIAISLMLSTFLMSSILIPLCSSENGGILINNKMSRPEIKKTIDNLIASKKVFVFSNSYCHYCVKAKQALDSYNIPSDQYLVWELGNEPRMHEIQVYMRQLTGGSTVPRVFINGKFIGGGDDTVRLHKSGQLATLLA